ncbi:MAG: methyltransferase domain-containing protein [Endomicrobium sp.]|jgi:hypothetical protein|nr:methyltransferase domain-containing protein [Endomicrobium sp.]
MRGNLRLKPLTKCRVCSGDLVTVEKMFNVPIDGMKLAKSPVKPSWLDFTIFKCSTCGHYQIQEADNFVYINDWNNTAEFSDIMKTWKASIKFLSSITKKHDKVIEVLAGKNIFGISEKYFGEIVRLSPDDIMKKQKNNHSIIYEFSVYTDGFDAIYIYDVLSHIENVKLILDDAFLILKEGGVGWIEVPNGLMIMDEQQYFSILPEHINYFTPDSLSMLVRRSGFQTVVVQSSLGNAHLDIFFKKPKRQLSFTQTQEKQISWLLRIMSCYNNVVIWGAGAKAHQIFGSYLLNCLNVKHIVDSGTYKHGLFIPGAVIPIEAPSKEIFANADVVIIFAISFEQEITRQLRDEFCYKKEILSLSKYAEN